MHVNKIRDIKKFLRILMVEDNPDDVEITQEAIKGTNVPINLDIAENGERALQFLRREGKYTDAPRPDIILLDINLPGIDGKQVLAEIKQDERLKRIPVIILTTSEYEEDIKDTYDLHANCYITKPMDLYQFQKIISIIEEFWMKIVKLPQS